MAIIGAGLDDQSLSSDESYNHLFLESEEPPVKGLYFQRGRILRGPDSSRPALDPSSRALVNVGGVRYSFPWTTLEDFPRSRLSRLRSCTSLKEVSEFCDDYDPTRREFFFDRDPFAFRTVFCFLANGKLRLLQDVCSVALHAELLYWGVDLDRMMPCCRHRVVNHVENVAQQRRREKEWREARKAARAEAVQRRSLFYKLGEVVDDPDSGPAGKVFACLSVVMVVVTVVSLCIGTMIDDQLDGNEGECLQQCRNMFLVETVCVIWFSSEMLVRFFHARSKLDFIRGPLNVTDAAAVLPYYISLFLELRDEAVQDIVAEGGRSTLDKLGLVLRVLRALRVLYVMRLARHSTGLQTLGLTIRRSFTDFGLLLLFVCVSVALFSPLVHLAESEPDAAGTSPRLGFSSIPASYWWTIISVTTVGYGDVVPLSTAGQLTALVVILSGILILSFPSTSIFHTFNRTYNELREERKRQHKEEKDAELVTEMEESLKERDSWPDHYSETDFLPGLEDPHYLFMTDIKVLAKSSSPRPRVSLDQNLV